MDTSPFKGKSVFIKQSVIDSLLTYSQNLHPREGILLLRVKARKDSITVTDILIPPFAVHGDSFSSFPMYMLPADLSIVGSAHSYPSGILRPSLQDVTHLYGLMIVIVGHPYRSKEDIAVFDHEGRRTVFTVI